MPSNYIGLIIKDSRLMRHNMVDQEEVNRGYTFPQENISQDLISKVETKLIVSYFLLPKEPISKYTALYIYI